MSVHQGLREAAHERCTTSCGSGTIRAGRSVLHLVTPWAEPFWSDVIHWIHKRAGEVVFKDSKDSDAHRREWMLLRRRNVTGADFQRMIAQMEAGVMDINPWITHRVTFTEAIDQCATWLNPQRRFIKAVIEVS